MMGVSNIPVRRASPTQKLAQASRVVCRALAGNRGRRNAGATDRELDWKLPTAEVPSAPTPLLLASWRGRVDAIAARARYGDPALHSRLAPIGESSRKLFDLLEQNRVEALASREFPGMRNNLAALCHERWNRVRPDGAIRGVGTGYIETIALIARVPLGAPLPQIVFREIDPQWRSWMAPQVAESFEALGCLIEDPERYARQSLQIVASVVSSDGARQPTPSGDARKQSDDIASRPTQAAQPGSDRGESSVRQSAGAEQHSESAPGRQEAADAARNQRSHVDPPYDVYTREFDRVAAASELRDAATLDRRRRELDRHKGAHLADITRWAHRLQRRLLALQLRSWIFDRDEGFIDAARLARVVTRPLEPLAYKEESKIEFPDTVVSLLVDNSGSMRGESMANAAACVEILGRVLERCGVSTEILGFTTGGWNGGRARRKWVAAGCPPRPGRIADLLHVIYKNADEPWRRARTKLGLMLEDDLLKENIDGEALLWAADRLQRRVESRRILIVICDGAPLDEATLAANGGEFLDRHLRTVIGRLDRSPALELLAIGIGHDVAAYYRRAVNLGSVEGMGEALVMQLIDLLAAPVRRTRQRAKRIRSVGCHAAPRER